MTGYGDDQPISKPLENGRFVNKRTKFFDVGIGDS
jgi:hypothetical protein